MTCPLFSAKLQPESILSYGKLDLWGKTFNEVSVEIQIFALKKMHLEYRLQIGSHFVSDPKVNINYRINKPNANYHKCISNKPPVYYPVTRKFINLKFPGQPYMSAPFSEIEI